MLLHTDPAEDLTNGDHAHQAAQSGDQPAREERTAEINDRIATREHADTEETKQGAKTWEGGARRFIFNSHSG